MTLTEGGSRLLAIASQMVSLGADAEAAVRAARGAPAQLRLLVNSTIAEFIATPLVEAFARRWTGTVETTSGVATVAEMRALLMQPAGRRRARAGARRRCRAADWSPSRCCGT